MPSFAEAQIEMQRDIVIRDSSSIKILGSSNLADFECNYESGFESDTLSYSAVIENKTGTIKGDTLKLDIEAFDCGRRGINRDLRKTLQYEQFPTIDITLSQFVLNERVFEKLNILISIAGVQKEYALSFDVTPFPESLYQIVGERKVDMSDFNLEAPRALLGLVRVDDELTITFNMFIHQL